MTARWLDEVEDRAREVLPAPMFRYIAEGARDEISLHEAVTAWRSLRVAPRVLRDVARVDTGTTVLGRRHRLPVGISPMTLQRGVDPGGEVAMARAAAAYDVPVVVPSSAGHTFSDIAATGATWWVQAYVLRDRSASEPVLRAAVDAGAGAVVLTVDTPVVGTRFPPEGQPSVWEDAEPSWLGANWPSEGSDPRVLRRAMDLGPDDIARLGEVTGLPVVVKGVLRPDDAERCLAAGAAAVWISNHGARQLDQVVATAHCVAAVREAVGAAAEVYVDGGIGSGLHVLLAVALGASCAFVGRPAFFALAADGSRGVERALGEIASEVTEAMRLTGCADLAGASGLIAPHTGP